MKIQELRQLTPKKLDEQLKKSVRELAVARFHTQTGQNQDTAKISRLRKMVAQIKTIKKEQSLTSQ